MTATEEAMGENDGAGFFRQVEVPVGTICGDGRLLRDDGAVLHVIFKINYSELSYREVDISEFPVGAEIHGLRWGNGTLTVEGNLSPSEARNWISVGSEMTLDCGSGWAVRVLIDGIRYDGSYTSISVRTCGTPR